MTVLTAEEHLIVLASRITGSDETDAQSSTILNRDIDWENVLELSTRYQVAPLLYRHLSLQGRAGLVPDDIIQHLQTVYRGQMMRNIRIYKELVAILRELERETVPVIVLKGAHLAQWLYGDPGLRPMNDIDLYGKRGSIHSLLKSLENIGYETELCLPSSLHYEYLLGHSEFSKESHAKFEVQGVIFRDSTIDNDAALQKDLWKLSVSVDVHGQRVPCLSPEHTLFYLSAHLLTHMDSVLVGKSDYLPFFWFCDIHELISQHGDLDWGYFSDITNRYSVHPRILALFDMMRADWSTPIPEDICRESSAARQSLSLPEIMGACNAFHVNTQEPSTQGEKGSRNTKQRAGQLRLRYCNKVTSVQSLKVRLYLMIRIVFPSRSYVIKKYSLKNNASIILFHLIHPVRIVSLFLVSFISKGRK
jgi:hypothetical protein